MNRCCYTQLRGDSYHRQQRLCPSISPSCSGSNVSNVLNWDARPSQPRDCRYSKIKSHVHCNVSDDPLDPCFERGICVHVRSQLLIWPSTLTPQQRTTRSLHAQPHLLLYTHARVSMADWRVPRTPSRRMSFTRNPAAAVINR